MRSMLRPLAIAKACWRTCAWGSVITATICAYSQQAQSAESTDQKPVFTLKVYTNLVQVPTLVLDRDRQPMPRVDTRRFQLKLDGGKVFAPTHVRMEGADPLSLAILIDVGTKYRNDLVAGIADAAAEMASKELHSQDRISIYLLSCNLLRLLQEAHPLPGLLSGSIAAGLQSPKLGKNSAGISCGTNVYLWAATATIVKEMSDVSGRRAILVIGDGHDDGSEISWPQLHEYAGVEGVALFGVRETPELTLEWQRDRTDVFRTLCESTGGVVMQGGRRDLQKRLQQWIEMLRGRYIMEFPRPQALSSGQHDIGVSIKNDWTAFTTVAGVSVSMPDPKLAEDPNYIPSDEGSDIPVGKRRPLPH